MVKQKRVYRRQRNPEVGLAQIQHVLSSPPKQFKLQTSPMPISPSYRAKVSRRCLPLQTKMIPTVGWCPMQGKTGLFSLPKEAIPVKPHPLVGQQQIASTGIFVPPGQIPEECSSAFTGKVFLSCTLLVFTLRSVP